MKKIFLIPFALTLSACATSFEKANEKFMEDFSAGNYSKAGLEMQQATQDEEKGLDDMYLGGLQCGTAYLWANQPTENEQCFAGTEAVLAGNVEEGSGYVLKNYEHIMLKTYTGLSELNTSDEHAKQTFKQAYALQVQNVNENDEEITKAQEEFNEDAATLPGMPDMNSIIAAVDMEMRNQDNAVVAMKDYVNPYTTYLTALYDALNGDKTNAENYMKRVEQFAPYNTYVKSDMDAINNKKDSVWIIFENGIVGEVNKRSLAPEILKNFDIKLTIPDVFPGTPALTTLLVNTSEEQAQTQFLADMTSVVKTDLDKYKTGNIIKSVAFEVAKVAAATTAGVVTGKAVSKQSDSALGTYAGLMTASLIMSAEKPWDLRSWNSLPTEIQSARLSMPADRKVIIENQYEVEIPEDINNAIIVVRVPTAQSIPGIIVGKLN